MNEENENIVENSYTDPITGKFKKDNPGKPFGAKKKKKMTDLIAEAIADRLGCPDKGDERVAEKIADALLAGDISLLKEYWQQKDGKAPQSMDVTSGGDKLKGVVILPQKNGDSMEASTETRESAG